MDEHIRSLTKANFEGRPVLDDISIVIPTLGRPIIESCLYWIGSGSAWPRELIIVDQGQNQQVEAWIKTLRSYGLDTRYVPSSQRGRAAGINRGLECVQTRFVAVTDDDCFVDARWLENMAGCLRESPETIVTGKVEAAGENGEFCVVTSTQPTIYTRPQLKIHPLIGGNMGVAMRSVERIGFFDEHPAVNSAEDSDWGYRALRLGIPILYRPEIMVRHYNWRDNNQKANRYRQYSRSQGGFYGKHLLSGDPLIALQTGRDLIRGPIRWLRGAVRQDADMIARGRADTLELVPGILDGLRRRRTL